MLDRRKQPQRALLIVLSVHAEKRTNLGAAVRRLAGLLRILAGNNLMQDIRCFCGRGFDVGQALAVNQRRALCRFCFVALLPPHRKKNFAHDLIREARERV